MRSDSRAQPVHDTGASGDGAGSHTLRWRLPRAGRYVVKVAQRSDTYRAVKVTRVVRRG